METDVKNLNYNSGGCDRDYQLNVGAIEYIHGQIASCLSRLRHACQSRLHRIMIAPCHIKVAPCLSRSRHVSELCLINLRALFTVVTFDDLSTI